MRIGGKKGKFDDCFRWALVTAWSGCAFLQQTKPYRVISGYLPGDNGLACTAMGGEGTGGTGTFGTLHSGILLYRQLALLRAPRGIVFQHNLPPKLATPKENAQIYL